MLTLLHSTDAVVPLLSLVRLRTLVRRDSNSLCLRHTSRLTSANPLSITLQISVTAVFVKVAITDATCSSRSSAVNILTIGLFFGVKLGKNISRCGHTISPQTNHKSPIKWQEAMKRNQPMSMDLYTTSPVLVLHLHYLRAFCQFGNSISYTATYWAGVYGWKYMISKYQKCKRGLFLFHVLHTQKTRDIATWHFIE